MTEEEETEALRMLGASNRISNELNRRNRKAHRLLMIIVFLSVLVFMVLLQGTLI